MFRKSIKFYVPLLLWSSCFLVFMFVPCIRAQPMPFHPIFKQDESVRNSKSKEILKYMNLSADPCQDFYAFACGNWERHHSHLKAHEVMTSIRYLENKIERDLFLLLEEQVTLDDGVNGRKVKEFYKSCKNALENDQKQQGFYSEFIKDHGGFPAVPGSNWLVHHTQYDWQQIVAELRRQYSMDILIGIDIELNPFNLYENSIYISEPSTILPPDLCSENGTRIINQRRAEYELIEQKVASDLNSWLSISSPEANKVASDILLFEFELCTAMHVAEETPMNNSRRSALEWTHYFNDSIDFYKFISSSYDLPYPNPISIRSEKYLRHLIHTIGIHDKETLANYIMYRALSMFSFPPREDKFTRPRYCTQVVRRYFPKVLGSMYYHKFANIEIKTRILEIFEKLKIAFENSLRRDWIQDGTSRVGRGKLNGIVLHFPNYEKKENFNNLLIDVNNYWQNMKQIMPLPRMRESRSLYATEDLQLSDDVEAYEVRIKYRTELKRIDVGWALLQAPFYQQHYPHSMQYAMIGQILGQELATAFDDINWTADKFNVSNWDHITALTYQYRAECFRREISYYLENNEDAFQNVTQLRKFIATSGGVNVAFAAYLNWLDFLSANNDFSILRKETLSDVNFTNTQLFFITYAQMQCQHRVANRTMDSSCPMQAHSLARYNVNGPLWNNVDFGLEFGCRIGTEMNPADKCIIY